MAFTQTCFSKGLEWGEDINLGLADEVQSQAYCMTLNQGHQISGPLDFSQDGTTLQTYREGSLPDFSVPDVTFSSMPVAFCTFQRCQDGLCGSGLPFCLPRSLRAGDGFVTNLIPSNHYHLSPRPWLPVYSFRSRYLSEWLSPLHLKLPPSLPVGLLRSLWPCLPELQAHAFGGKIQADPILPCFVSMCGSSQSLHTWQVSLE